MLNYDIMSCVPDQSITTPWFGDIYIFIHIFISWHITSPAPSTCEGSARPNGVDVLCASVSPSQHVWPGSCGTANYSLGCVYAQRERARERWLSRVLP